MTTRPRLRPLTALVVGSVLLGLAAAPAHEARAAATPDALDSYSRAAVAAAWNGTVAPALAVPTGWTGDVAGCRAGEPSGASQQATLDVLNVVRDLADLPRLRLDATLSAQAQQAALIMDAQNALSHWPPSTWACWTEVGSAAAGKSNLALGLTTGPAAVLAYMDDPGSTNTPVGHRRWILYPDQRAVGNGQTSGANALHVLGEHVATPDAPEFVPWPTAGYLPVQLEPEGRWSLSSAGADFSAATVRVVAEGGQQLPVTLHPLKAGYGHSTLVWQVSHGFTRGAPDRSFEVTVAGIQRAGRTLTRSWTVRLFDPARTDAQVAVPPPVTTVTAVDSSPPVLEDLGFWPATVDARAAATEVTYTARLTDVSGARSPRLRFVHDRTGEVLAWRSISLVSGTERDGTWQGTVPVPRGARPGTWTAVLDPLGDRVGNVGGGGTPAGFPTTLTVAGDPPTVPAAPSITSVGTDGDALSVEWSPPDDGGTPITGYRVRLHQDGKVLRTVDTDAIRRQLSFEGLVPRTAYSVTVAAVNDLGTGPESARSAEVVPVTVPAAPVIGVPSVAGGVVTVRWRAPDDGAPVWHYRVRTWADGVPLTTQYAPAGTGSLELRGLHPGVPHTFAVDAENGWGRGPESARSAPVVIAETPGAPVLGRPLRGDRSVTLRWSPPGWTGGAPVTGYLVETYRGTARVQATTVPAGALGTVVRGLANGVAYRFTVAATTTAGTGTPADAVTATPATRPGAPRVGRLSARGGAVTVRWSPPPADGGAAISGYVVRTYRAGSLVRTTTVPAGARSTVIRGLPKKAEHRFTVTARNAVGPGPASRRSAAVRP